MGNTNSSQKLLSLKDDDIKFFSFKGETLIAKVSNVYDADTIYVIIELNENKFYKFKIRLDGIDSPEIKPLKSCPNRDLNMICAKKCKDILSSLILYKIVELKCKEYDKYGRILADVYINGININQVLFENKLVKSYHGSKKNEWTVDELNYISNFDVDEFKYKNSKLF